METNSCLVEKNMVFIVLVTYIPVDWWSVSFVLGLNLGPSSPRRT
jgi:hypothetical protein